MTKDNMTKYLFYALGEILLLVIGILIALQINNWNENRKRTLKEKEIATNLSHELSQNLSYTKHQKKNAEFRIKKIQKLLAQTNEEQITITENEFFKLVFYALSSDHYKPINSRSTKILSSEDFNFTLSPELISELTNFNLITENLISVDKENEDNWKLNMLPLLIKSYPVKNLINSLLDDKILRSKHKIELRNIINDLDFENILASTYIDALSYRKLLDECLNSNEKLLSILRRDYELGMSKN